MQEIDAELAAIQAQIIQSKGGLKKKETKIAKPVVRDCAALPKPRACSCQFFGSRDQITLSQSYYNSLLLNRLVLGFPSSSSVAVCVIATKLVSLWRGWLVLLLVCR